MEKNDNQSEEEINSELRSVENEKERLDEEVKRFEREEEAEEDELNRMYQSIEDRKSACGSSDYEILQLLEEKQSVISEIKWKKNDFQAEFRHEIAKQREQLEERSWNLHEKMKEKENVEKEEEQDGNG